MAFAFPCRRIGQQQCAPTGNSDYIPASPNHASVPKRTQQPTALLLNGPAQVASKQLLKAKLYYWSIIASASPAPPAPRRALPVANRLRACPPAQRPQQPPRAVTAAQSTIWTPAAAARAHGLPSQVSKVRQQGQDVCRRGTREACHWHPLLSSLPTSWATTSRNWDAAHLPQGVAAPGAVGFQVVGVVLLPCIDDVKDREIEHHRRERWRHDIAYAASVSFMPSHHKCVHLAREASSFPDETVTACWSAAFAYPHAQLAPHRLLTFPPAVPRGPDKTPLSLPSPTTVYPARQAS